MHAQSTTLFSLCRILSRSLFWINQYIAILTNNDGRWARYARKRTDLDVVDIVPGVVVVGNVEVVHIVIVVVVVVVVIVVVAVGIVHNIGSHRCSRPKKPRIKF